MARPNIVLILADDMGYGDLSCLNSDSRIHTPHMDRLSRQGMAFTDAHASTSVCTPSRYGILTGCYAWRGPLQRGVLGPYEAPLIAEGQPTLSQFLRDCGYATDCVGKWHLGMDWPFRSPRSVAGLSWNGPEIVEAGWDVDYGQEIRNGPLARGFDTYFGVDVPNFPPYCFVEGSRTVGVPDRTKPESVFGTPGPMLEGWDLTAILPALTRRAVSAIEHRAAETRPFFLYFSLTGPHTPMAPTPEFRGRSDAGLYGDWVTQIDHTVGQVMDALETNGIAGDTLLIVTSDNGSPGRTGNTDPPGSVQEVYGHNPSWILRGMKSDTWEGGHRIPLLVRWPGRIPAGTTSDALVCLLDLWATCAAILGESPPSGSCLDSYDLQPYLYGQVPARPVREVIVHHGGSGLYGVRRNEWKLITGTGSGGFSPNPPTTVYDPPGQLYHILNDIREQHNLYTEHPQVVYELSALLARCRFQATAPAERLRETWGISE